MPNITAAELHALRDAAVAQQSSSGGSNRGSAPAGYTSSTAGKTKVLDPDSSAYAANVKDKYKETQQPWYIVQEESAKNADTSAHAQKEKDSYVTGNILYHQWEQQQKNLKADSSAHAQAEKDDEAEKNPLFHQWKTAFDRQQEQKAAANEYKINKLQKELDELDRNSAYITTTDQYDEYQNKRKDVVTQMEALGWKDEKTNIFKGTGSRTTEGLNSVQIVEYNRLLAELDELNRNAGYSSTTAASEEYEQRRKELLTQLHTIDKQAGREERTYDSRERTGAFFKSWGTGTGASYTNAAANLNEITTSAQGMEREIAELEAQASKAQTAYDEAVRQYGEAGATFEKNLLIDAQQKLEAKKAQYAGMEKERAYDSKAQAVSQNLYNTADKLLTQSEQEMAKAKYGTSAVGSFALDAAKTGLDIAADTAVSALGVPGLVNMAVRVYGSEAQQARLQGDDAQTAAAKGLKSALIEVATEKIAGPFEKAYGKTALSSTINKAVDKLNASGLLKWAADTMGEGFEEGMSDVLNIVADHMMGWDSGENSIWGDIAADKDEIMYDMLLGAFVGAFGATGNAIGTRANTSPTVQEQTQVQQTAPVQTEATQQNVVSAEAVEQVSRVLENGRVNNSTANEIASTPTLADAFYEVTGIALEGSTAAKRETVKTTAREYAYAKQQTEQAAADIAAQRQQTQTEADAALAAYSQQEAERQAAIEAGAQRGQREAAARERAEATSTPYDSYIRGVIQNGGSYAEAGEIARTPQLRAAWERMTGITLPDTVNKARDVIMNTRMNVYTPQMNYAQFMADEQNAPSQQNIDNGNAMTYNNTNVNVANNTGGMTDVAGRSVEADSGRVSGVYRTSDSGYSGRSELGRTGVGSGLVLLSPQAKDTLAKRGVAVVETQDVSNDKPAFSVALDAARANDSVNGWAVTPKSVAELEESGAKLIMAADGTTGLAIAPDGDIEAVFANKAAGAPKGATKTTIPQAIANGGTKLDCYGVGLLKLYSQYGFVPVARVKFNPEYANQGWDTSKGMPDIFFMMHNGDSADTVIEKMGKYNVLTPEELNALPVMDYDEAYSYRDGLLANSRKATDVSQTAGDNSALPTAQNVKQGGSDALNSAVNYNSRETAAEAPAQEQKNTASTQETESTAVNDAPSTHTAEEMKRIEEYKAAVDDNLVNYIETVRNNPGAKIGRYSLKPVSERAANDIKAITGVDVSGNKTSIEPRIISHIFKGHGERGKTDSSMRDINDIARMQYILDNYDTIEDGGRSSAYQTIKPNGKTGQARTVVFSKAIDGTYYVVEAVPDTKAKTVFVVTAYLTNKKTGDMQTANAEATRVTSETKNAQSPVTNTSLDGARRLPNDGSIPSGISSEVSNDISSDTSIPTDTQNVNGKFEGNYRSNLGKGNGTRTTQTVETINNADITTDARREQLSPYVKNGRFDYIPDTNKAQVERATKAIAKNGWEASYRDFHDAVIQGKSSADLVAQGAVLMNSASNSEASAREYLDLASDYMELLHRAGETLQAGKILQQLTPEGRLYGMTKTVSQINKKLTKGQRKAIAKAREGDNYRNIDINDVYINYEVELNETLTDKYLKAETDEQRNAVISEIQQNIADQIPATFVEKWNAMRYVNMLGNFKTQERNILGNTAMLVTQTAKNRVKAAAEVTANLFRAEDNKIERTAVFHVNKELRAEAAADFENIKDIARGEGKYSDSAQMSKDIQDKRRIFNSELLEKYRKVTNWAMDAGDVIFLKANYADALGGWLKAHGINSIEDATPEQLDRGRAYAIKEAQEATFRDDNIISKKVNQIGRNPVTEGIMPFRKTPANVAVRAVEYSPIGIAETIYKGVQAKNGNATANDVINSLSKNILGTGLATAGYALAKAGFARGSEEDDDLDQFQKMQGKQDYAVKIGDEWISLSQLAPNSVPLYMGVMLYEALDGGGLTWEDAYKILGCLNDPMMDMSMLSGVNDALADVVTYGDDGTMIWKVLGNAMLSYLTQGINNSLIGQAEQMWEENRQTVYADKDSILPNNVQYKLGKALGKIPGVDYHQQDYVDAWGRTQSNGSVGERFFDAFLNPFYSGTDSTTEVDAELERLYTAGKNVEGFPNVLPEKASRSMEYVKGKTMTPDEYKQYSIDRGQKSLELVTDFMNSAEYDNLSDQQRAEVISDLYSLASQQAINKVKAANGLNETTLNKYKGVSDENMPEYLAARQVFSDAATGKDGTDYSAVDAMVENFDNYSPEVQQKLMGDNYNVTDLVYADKLGQDAAIYYGCKTAIEKNADKLGGTDAAKAISVYNYMHDMGKSDAEVLAAAKAQLKPEAGGEQNTTIRRIEAYNTVAGDKANLGEWLNLVAELHDADENSSISKGDVYAAWGNMGLGEKETYAGITRDDFYNIVKNGSKSYAVNEKYATQFDEVYAALVPSAEKTKNTLANSVSGHNTATEDTQSGTK